jgi:hypothetical protein
MKWVRSKARHVSLLALFALAIQLALSFGHFHSDGLAQAATLAAQSTADQDQAATASLPDHRHPDGLAADSCAICATIALSGTLITSAAPMLPVPAIFAVADTSTSAGVALPNLTRSAFQSRAPPRS